MKQIRMIGIVTDLYQFSVRKLLRSLEKQQQRELKRFDRGVNTARSLEQTAEEIKKLAAEKHKEVRSVYGENQRKINSATNFLQNVQDDINKQQRYI